MTAYWRSLYPNFSHDPNSKLLASSQGIAKAKEFEERFEYPLVARKVSVRAGYILQEAKRLLKTGQYDACISLASGFSLLTYCIADELGSLSDKIKFYDVDLPHMLAEREKRISSLTDRILNPHWVLKIHNVPADLEKLYQENCSFRDLFVCKRPLFIIEGVIYFLSESCVNWIIDSIHSFENSAMICDYWPEGGTQESACFKRVVDSMKDFIPETIKSFWDEKSICEISSRFQSIEIREIADIERQMSDEVGQHSEFTDPNLFFPVRFMTAIKTTS